MTELSIDFNDVRPEKGDICRHVRSGREYVLYAVQERELKGGGTLFYPTFLMQEDSGKLSEPFVIFGGTEVMAYVERGAPREPGEKPVRNLNPGDKPGIEAQSLNDINKARDL